MLLALLAPIAALAAAGGCEDECAPGCGDCGLCLGAAVAPAEAPGVPASGAALAASGYPLCLCTLPLGVPEPVPIPRA
jgi:hypothetical protein